MIEIKNLVKYYGDIKAVDNISFDVKAGEVLGFLGPNGAGKSTTMNILTGAISASSGTVKIDGFDILEEPEKAKAKVGYLPEQPPLYTDMTVFEYLTFIADLKLVPKNEQLDHLAKIMTQLKISDVRNRLINNLSKGYKQRVGVAQALVGDPDVIILDEPTVGLDPKQIKDIRNVIRSLGKKHTVIISSHILSEIQATCDRVVIIANGKLAYQSDINALGEVSGDSNKVEITVKDNVDSAYRLLKTFSEIKNVERINKSRGETVFIYETAPDIDIREKVFKAFADSKLSMLGMREFNATLEDIFLKVTNRSYVQTLEEHEVEIESEEDEELDQWDQAQLVAKEQEVAEKKEADSDLDSVENSNENMKEEK